MLTGLFVLAAAVGLLIWMVRENNKKIAAMTPEERERHFAEQRERAIRATPKPKSSQIVCEHCQARGTVHVKAVKQKKGISGGKATAALLTGGVTLLVTGLSRKEALTRAHCTNCNTTWHY